MGLLRRTGIAIGFATDFAIGFAIGFGFAAGFATGFGFAFGLFTVDLCDVFLLFPAFLPSCYVFWM